MKALRLSNRGFKIGDAKFGTHGDGIGSVKQIVHDGDTVSVRLYEDLGVRFLGIDTAEWSFTLPGTKSFVQLKDERWDELFTTGAWRQGLIFDDGLMAHLESQIRDGFDVGPNHARHAQRAQTSLENILQEDLDRSGKAKEDFQFFLAFGHEFLDGYGRLLCFLNSAVENFADPAEQERVKQASYNERQLANGAAYPYFIWPNTQPFLALRSFSPENIHPDAFWKLIGGNNSLNKARQSVRDARTAGLGIHAAQDPLRLPPAELRFICRRSAPDRYVIDLSRPGSGRLIRPERYYTIPFPEDRLYIPKEYYPVFRVFGWGD